MLSERFKDHDNQLLDFPHTGNLSKDLRNESWQVGELQSVRDRDINAEIARSNLVRDRRKRRSWQYFDFRSQLLEVRHDRLLHEVYQRHLQPDNPT